MKHFKQNLTCNDGHQLLQKKLQLYTYNYLLYYTSQNMWL